MRSTGGSRSIGIKRVAEMNSGLETARSKRASRFEELYDAHMTAAVRFAYLISGDSHLAQDLAHDAFLKVSSRLWALRSPEKFPAYLRSTILNAYRSHYRRQRRERTHLATKRTGTDPSIVGPDLGSQDEIRRALNLLPPRRKTAVILRYYEDMTEQQTAETMGCSVGAVKALVARGLRQLRAALEGEPDDSI